MGGGEPAKSLFEANVIDEIGLNIHPVLLGSGIPLFLPMERQRFTASGVQEIQKRLCAGYLPREALSRPNLVTREVIRLGRNIPVRKLRLLTHCKAQGAPPL
jgi:hypothetical protein